MQEFGMTEMSSGESSFSSTLSNLHLNSLEKITRLDNQPIGTAHSIIVAPVAPHTNLENNF
jgi:hypothetical protein